MMIQTNWVDTQQLYHDIINAPDEATRNQRYLQGFVGPWEQMMSMTAGMFAQVDQSDPFSGAKGWHWLTPDKLAMAPASMQRLEAVNAWEQGAAAMSDAVRRFAAYTERIPFDSIEGWLILADPETSDPIGQGYTGATDFFQPRFVVQYSDPTDENIPKLPGCIVHEMHHLIRLRVFPWDMANTTVADYIVHEGMAESFAKDLYGEDVLGHYVTDFDSDQIGTARQLIGDNLTTTGFDKLRAFIFGDYWSQKLGLPIIGMPTFGGYAIGYHVVQAYLARTGHSIEAATFVPAMEIVTESDYFD